MESTTTVAMMRRGAAMLVLSSIAFSQDAQQASIALLSKPPLQLAQYLESHEDVDWESLWSALGTRDPEVQYAPCGKGSENPCWTQIVTISNPDQEILIVQGELLRRNDIYLRYLREANGDWQFAGARRAFVHGEFPRRHEVMRLGVKPFLKISSDHTQVGFALRQEVEDWFDLTQPGFERVFSFTAQGSSEPFRVAVGHTVQARAFARGDAGQESIDLELNVTFDGPGLYVAAKYVGVYDRP